MSTISPSTVKKAMHSYTVKMLTCSTNLISVGNVYSCQCLGLLILLALPNINRYSSVFACLIALSTCHITTCGCKRSFRDRICMLHFFLTYFNAQKSGFWVNDRDGERSRLLHALRLQVRTSTVFNVKLWYLVCYLSLIYYFILNKFNMAS